MAAITSGRAWHAGRARQVPSTFRTKERRFRGRIYLRADNVTTELLCAHVHETEAEAEACAEALRDSTNRIER